MTASLLAVFLCACAEMGVVTSKDPVKNLAHARELFPVNARGVPAQKLVWDALSSFTETKNEEGRAEALMAYGEFLISPSLNTSEGHFRKHGFLDPSVTFDNHVVKAVEYFDKATPLLFAAKRFDLLTTASTQRGVALMNLGKRDDACASFDQSVSFHDEQIRRNPDAKPSVPEGYGSWKAYMSRLQKWAGCAG